MASNSRIRQNQGRMSMKQAQWWQKFRRDIKKIQQTGETPNHYVGGGQPFTRGKKS